MKCAVAGCSRQILEHGLALATALLAVGFVEKDLGARLVQVIAEIEAPGNPAGETPLAAADRPSRYDLRKAGDIRLRVATVHTQGVQFKNFARQVFVDAELALAPAAASCASSESLPTEDWLSRKAIMAGCCSTAINRSTKRPATFGRIASFSRVPARPSHRALVGRHRKVIGPKVNQAFGKRPRGEGGALRACQNLRAIVG